MANPRPDQKNEPWKDPGAQPYVRLEKLTKKFGDFVAVDDVSLNIYRGEIFCLLGGSGSGKTTLLRMMAGFERPTEGRIWIDGADVTGDAALRAARQHDVPVLCALPAHERAEERRLRPASGQGVGGRDRRAGHGHPEARAHGVVRQAHAAPALRRPAPARRARARAHQAPEAPAARRAARRARQEAARAHAVRAAEHPGQARRHLRGRDPRPGGGDDAREPHRRHEPRRDRADRHARRTSTSIRARGSWRTSSAR